MPTIREALDAELQAYIRATQFPCWKCKGEGSIELKDMTRSTCPECCGAGRSEPDPGFTIGPMMSTCIRQTVNARDAGRFGEMNEILDWAIQLLDNALKHYLDTKPEEVERTLKRLADAHHEVREEAKTSKMQLSGALTDDELRELGIVAIEDTESDG